MPGQPRRKSTSDIMESKDEFTLVQATAPLTSNPTSLPSTSATKMRPYIHPPPPPTSDSCEECNCFLNTPDFRRLLISFVPADTLLAMTLLDKKWGRMAKQFIDDGVEVRVRLPLERFKRRTKARHQLVSPS